MPFPQRQNLSHLWIVLYYVAGRVIHQHKIIKSPTQFSPAAIPVTLLRGLIRTKGAAWSSSEGPRALRPQGRGGERVGCACLPQGRGERDDPLPAAGRRGERKKAARRLAENSFTRLCLLPQGRATESGGPRGATTLILGYITQSEAEFGTPLSKIGRFGLWNSWI